MASRRSEVHGLDRVEVAWRKRQQRPDRLALDKRMYIMRISATLRNNQDSWKVTIEVVPYERRACGKRAKQRVEHSISVACQRTNSLSESQTSRFSKAYLRSITDLVKARLWIRSARRPIHLSLSSIIKLNTILQWQVHTHLESVREWQS